MAGGSGSRAVWRKSSYSNVESGGSDCVEVATVGDGRVALRDSKHPDSGILTIPRAELAAFIAGVKQREFDDLT
jgi:hypothetical protein